MQNAKICLYPRDASEAVRILSENGKRALILAGGTTASANEDPQVTILVDLTRMGLDTIEWEKGQWTIGCNVRLDQLAQHPGLAALYGGMLVEAVQAVGSTPIRNAVTLGGSAVQVFRWSDPPVALLAMDACFDLQGPGGERTLGADAFFAQHPQRVLNPAEILTRIRIQESEEDSGGAFVKLAKTEVDLAVVDVAVRLICSGRRCTDLRIVVGATQTLPWRAQAAEDLLTGKRLGGRAIAAAARAAREAARCRDDVRTDGEYRAEMVEVMVRRALKMARERARQQS